MHHDVQYYGVGYTVVFMMDSTHVNLPRTRHLLEGGLAQRVHIGVQLYVSRNGQVVANWALGEAQYDVPMTVDTLMVWFSCSKPIGAVAIAQLWEQGKLALDDPVCIYIPEFGANGKTKITIRHVLTHTGGFLRDWNWREYTTLTWPELITRICAAPLESDWIPGRTAGYHPASAWFLLGELVRRIDGRPYEQYVRDAIFLPLGMHDCWVGMPPDVYGAYGSRIGVMHNTQDGTPTPYPNAVFDSLDACVRCNPGERGRGPMHQLGAFYEMLLGCGTYRDRPVLLPQTVEALTAPQRVGLPDRTRGDTAMWALGFVLDERAGRHTGSTGNLVFGQHCSPRTFGHGGYRSSLSFADPEHHLVVAVVFNGTPDGEAAYQRSQGVATAIYKDLNLDRFR